MDDPKALFSTRIGERKRKGETFARDDRFKDHECYPIHFLIPPIGFIPRSLRRSLLLDASIQPSHSTFNT